MDSVQRKIIRLALGAKPRVLDLFAGCGGLSLGFRTAGFEITGAVEIDSDAARSHGENFHSGRSAHVKARDITQVRPDELCADFELGDASQAFDIIIGGPPCQAFARVGRSKLREVADHPEAFRHDLRARHYIDYLEYVERCQPLAVVMENVPDMLNHGGHNIAGEVCDVLSSRGYTCGYTLLNAAFYGVPQMRERMILIAIRAELAPVEIFFPRPTHWINLPSGYEGSRAVAMKLLAGSNCRGPDRFFRSSPGPTVNLQASVTARDALWDLPRINARALLKTGVLRRGARRLNTPISYVEPKEPTVYTKLMREWPSFEAGPYLMDHVIRYLPRDYALFARLKPGDQYPQAFKAAEEMFEEALSKARGSGSLLRKGSKRWDELRKKMVPPYDDSKFPNKWRKMEADKPARTLLAHLGKDSYTHIHYDSTQARTISVREAARLQSFPDGFKFCGTMNPAFRQIGNAVPPLLARAIAEAVLLQMASTLRTQNEKVAVGGRR